jgi:hypothetical protein
MVYWSDGRTLGNVATKDAPSVQAPGGIVLSGSGQDMASIALEEISSC